MDGPGSASSKPYTSSRNKYAQGSGAGLESGWMEELAVFVDMTERKEAMLPSVLNRQDENWTARSTELQRLHEMKARQVEHVRFKSAKPPLHDARLCIQPRVDIGELITEAPGSASVNPGRRNRGELSKAMTEEAADKIDGPNSASSNPYTGGRKVHRRYEYAEGSGAGFIEFSPDHVPTDEQFFEMLARVTGNIRIAWKPFTTKTILVKIGSNSANRPLEFQLTKQDHRTRSNTITACFKEPPRHLVPEAWRILCEATDGKQLLPSHVQEYRAKILEKWEQGLLNSQRHMLDKVFTPGSASQSNGLPRHMAYGGSRQVNQRFAYNDHSGAGFCELAQGYVPTDEQFFQ